MIPSTIWSESFFLDTQGESSYTSSLKKQVLITQAIFAPDTSGSAEIITKETGIFCGEDTPGWAYDTAAPAVKIKSLVKDGAPIKRGDKLFTVSGPVAGILAGERITLNFLQRMCGIATETSRLTGILAPSKTKILDTRKTLPGFRHIDKYAVMTGGGRNHRMGLYDMVMIKDNHIAAAGGIGPAVRRVKDVHGAKYKSEVETETLDEVRQAWRPARISSCWTIWISPLMKEAIELISSRAETEISGNITAERLVQLKDLGADYISIGALTHSVRAFDISMLINSD